MKGVEATFFEPGRSVFLRTALAKFSTFRRTQKKAKPKMGADKAPPVVPPGAVIGR